MGGQKKARREAFFAEHPICCFCGGFTPAVEEDHIPSRYLFREKQWPLGYVFPACAGCNRASSADELAMGWLVRIAIKDSSPLEKIELERTLRQLAARKQHWINAMKELSRVDTRRFLRENGVSKEFSSSNELYVVTMPDELAEVPPRYGEKLGRALYYMHTKRIFPTTGKIVVAAFTNATFMSPKFEFDDFAKLAQKPTLARNGKSLDDQFTYQFATAIDGHAAVFYVRFGQSLALKIFAFEDVSRYDHRAAQLAAAAIAIEEA